MKKQELEALTTAELRQVIVDATMVLAARGEKSEAAAKEDAAPAAPGGSSLFTFGVANTGGFAPPARTEVGSSLFGNPASGGLFGRGAGETGTSLFGVRGFSPSGTRTSADTSVKFEGEKSKADEKSKPDEGVGSGGENDLVQEEEVVAVAGWTPSITLEVQNKIETGEEAEEQVYSQRSKLYKFKDAEWKERGLGDAKLLKNKETGKIRFLLRQEKTGKVVANFVVIDSKPLCDLRPNADSEKIWVWNAQDCSEDDGPHVEQFALKFGSEELAGKFKEAFDSAKESNKGVA